MPHQIWGNQVYAIREVDIWPWSLIVPVLFSRDWRHSCELHLLTVRMILLFLFILRIVIIGNKRRGVRSSSNNNY